jgi:predicted alpha/beta superfamily hydrolase
MLFAAAFVAACLASNAPPGVTGTTRLHEAMRSASCKELLPRNVIVWLPPGYDDADNAARRYPVLYMHDGQNIFDPATAFLGREWHADETADELIRRKAIPPIIIVGIWNTPERVADYTPDQDPDEKRGDNKPAGLGGEGARYLKWIATELKPFIDATYRTKPGRESTAIVGSSLGGLISLAAAENHADTFGLVAAVSPSLWWNRGSVIERWKQKTPKIDRLWMDMGDKERAGMTDQLRRFEQVVRAGFTGRLHVEVVPGGTHDEPSWAARLGRILVFLFGDEEPRK